MKAIANIFLKGLGFCLPLVITFGLLYWLFATAENILKLPLQYLLPEGWYITGMGVASAVIIVFCLGILVQAYLIKYVLQWITRQIERIPIVSTLYTSARDLMQFFAGDKKKDINRVVAVTLDNQVRLIGFVTNEHAALGAHSDLYAVYFPMSYQVGGYLAYIDKSRCEVLDIPVQKAMQQVLTAHVRK